MSDRQALAYQASAASVAARQHAKFDLVRPICIYALCEAHGVKVRFNDVASMEGLYERTPEPRIYLSALRPLVRRAYTCGHELGHHIFGHGSTIDELREEGTLPSDNPQEFLAETFAAFALMPTLGLRHAFAVRQWNPENASPVRMLTVASNFGVGYRTLITHLSYGIRVLSRQRATQLLRTTPRAIHATICGEHLSSGLIVTDDHTNAPTMDAEVGMHLVLPAGVAVSSDVLVHVRNLGPQQLYKATRPGIARAASPDGHWSLFVRVARPNYVGRATFRHLEEELDD
jgi:Zn-dependent peptidase ImmA (M78 family)